MKKKIAILGSTGSIGKSLIDIIKKDKINYEYEIATTKLIADWIASCPVNFVNVKVPINDEVQLTLSRTRKE